MTFEEMVKAGRKFTSNGSEVIISDTNLCNGKHGIMLGYYKHTGDFCNFFDKDDGEVVNYDGVKSGYRCFNLKVVEEEREGWFALSYHAGHAFPTMTGIFETEEEARKSCAQFSTFNEVHKIIFKCK